ncbi:MAG: hypothetical protein RIQ93_498 [Verrucomicrobiota bacterium]|jgi:peptidoglycan/xylan/chitin deacetylase (PgdA/CDA1 family)
MPARFTWVAIVLLGLLTARDTCADTSRLSFSSPQGATLSFTGIDGRWHWSGLLVPGAAAGVKLTDGDASVETDLGEQALSDGWELVESSADHLVFTQTAGAAGLTIGRVFSFGPAENIVRVETWAQSLGAARKLARLRLLDLRIAGEFFQETGAAPASFPLFGQSFFMGIEHVSGLARAEADRGELNQTPHVMVGSDWQFVAAGIVGWAGPSDCNLITGRAVMRAAFLRYLETVRVKPDDFELHTNTWWTLPLPFSEQDVLKDIDALHAGFAARTGMFFDSFALDLGWSNNRSIWQVDQKRFPNEFRVIKDRLAAFGSKLGIWVSPGSAYPEGLDNRWLASAGYEVTPFEGRKGASSTVACFALGGKYQREFKDNLVKLARDYDLRHVKLDFLVHRCDVPGHGHPPGADSAHAIAAGLADVLDSLRAINPKMVLEPLCCGYPPSPWWTMKTPYVLGPYGDDVPYGRVPSPEWMESLITARDIAYRMDQEKWLMPTQAMETIDIVVQSPGNFENLAVMAIGRGRWFLSTYLKPELMPAKNWDFLAALVRWARANRDYLVNAISIGGNPQKREAYGYLFHNADKDIYCGRNPWMGPRLLQLPVCDRITETRELRMIYPRRETIARLEPGQEAPVIRLGPYETVMLETVPAGAEPDPLVVRLQRARLESSLPVVEVQQPDYAAQAADPLAPEKDSELTFFWKGVMTTPGNLTTAELCVVVEGGTEVNAAKCTIFQSGVAVKVARSGSAGQFGAAIEPSPDNWTWFTTPVPPNTPHEYRVYVEAPAKEASIGIYVRGATPAAPTEEADPDRPAFPLFRADTRPWSQTLLPVRAYGPNPLAAP